MLIQAIKFCLKNYNVTKITCKKSITSWNLFYKTSALFKSKFTMSPFFYYP